MNMLNYFSPRFARALLVLLTAVAFFPALSAGFITWDDPPMVLHNPYYHDLSPEALYRLFTQPYLSLYQPLTVLTIALQYRIAGVDPFFLHLVNLLLHLGSVMLAFELARKLGLGTGSAFAAAFLFAVHPSRADSVAWLTERKDVLFAFFYLLGLYLHQYNDDPGKNGIRRPVYLCFVFSLFSKPSAVSFPFVLAVLDRFRHGTPILEGIKRCRFILIPIALVSIVIFTAPTGSTLDKPFSASTESGIIDRTARVFLGVGAIIRHLAVPNDIPSFIPYFSGGFADWPAEAGVWVFSALLFCGLLFASRHHPLRQCGLLFFLAALLPICTGIFFHGLGRDFTAVRHGYLAGFGLFLCVADCLRAGFERLQRRDIRKGILAALAAAVLLGAWMIGETRRRCAQYDDGITFWNAVIRQTPHHISYTNRGMSFFQAGDYENARSDFRIVTNIKPDYSRGWVHLAATEMALGKPDLARSILEEARRKWPGEPMIHDYLGLIAAGASRTDEAVAHYTEAIRLDPAYVSGMNNRAAAYRQSGEYVKALADLDAALRLAPGNRQLQAHRDSIASMIHDHANREMPSGPAGDQ